MEALVKALDDVVRVGRNIVKGDVLRNFYKELDEKIPLHAGTNVTGDLIKNLTQAYFKIDNDVVKFEPCGAIKNVDDFKFSIRNGKFFDMYKNLVDEGKIRKSADISAKTFKPIEDLFQTTFPDHNYNKIMIDDLNKIKSHFGNELADTVPRNLDHLKDLYTNNSKFKKFIDDLAERPKSRLKTFLIEITIGGGLIALLNTLYQLSQDMAGCWRYYQTDDGKSASCKINQASCKYPHVVHQCSQIPDVIRNANPAVCQGWDESKEHVDCRKCDPNAPTQSLQYLDSKDFVKPSDIYRCRGPGTVGEMAANIVNQIPEIIHTSTDIITHIISILKYAIVGIIIVIVIAVVYKGYNIFIGYKTQQQQEPPPSPYYNKIKNV
jgi:hypothetical protein